MAFGHGKDEAISLGTAGTPGTPVDIKQYVNSVSFPREVDSGEVSKFGDGSKKYIVGLKDSTISFEGPWDPAGDAQFAALLGVQDVAFEYYPQGNASGKVKYSGVAIMTSYETSGDLGSPVGYTAELQVSGDVTRALVA